MSIEKSREPGRESLINQSLKGINNAYPKPDKSNYRIRLEKTPEEPYADLGYFEGNLSDGRPFRAELFMDEDTMNYGFFMSAIGIEEATEEFFVELLEKESLVTFEGEKSLAFGKIKDANENDLWSITVCAWDEDGFYANTNIKFNRYEQS